MKIKTSSGCITVNKKSPYGKWLQGYVSTGAFSGGETIRQVWGNALTIKEVCPSISWHDLGKLSGNVLSKIEVNQNA